MLKSLSFFLYAILFSAALILFSLSFSSDEKPLSINKKAPNEFLQKKIDQKSKPKYDRPSQAMKYRVDMLSEINKPFSYPANWQFIAFREAQEKAVFNKQTDTYTWIERGPGNVGGRTRSIAVHPQDEDIWWVAAVGGGIWKTTDAGESWTNQTDEMPSIATTTIALCTNNPNILYAGTGEGFYNYDAIWGNGIFKTENGGETWTQLASTAGNADFRFVNRLIVDPAHPDTVVAATNSGVFRSTNGGVSWTETFSSGRIQQVIANPSNFQTLFMTHNSGGIYKSTNGGQTWTKTSTFTSFSRIELAIAPSDTNIVFAAVEAGGSLKGLYRSGNAGTTWSLISESSSSPTNWLGFQGWYDNTLAISPNNPDEIIVGGIDLYRLTLNPASTSYTVTKLTHWYIQNSYPYVHADQHYLITLPVSETTYKIIAANDGGIHYSVDSGNSWTDKNNGFNVTQYYDGDRSPIAAQYIGGTQDNGTHVSPEGADAGSAWDEPIGGDGFDCAWDKYNPNVVYGTLYDTRIYKSTNGGLSFFSRRAGIGPSNIFHTPLALNPLDPKNLITATNHDSIYITNDAAESWHGQYIDFGGSGYIKVAYSRSTENIVWAGSYTAKLHVSINKGESFSPVSVTGEAPSAYFTGINTSPKNDSTAYLTFGVSSLPKIFRTLDLGQSWTNITGNLPNVPVYTILEMPYNAQELWAGTEIGLFISADGGTTWTLANDNLPSVAIHRLKTFGKEVISITHGRGFFTTTNEKLPDFEIAEEPPKIESITYSDPETREVVIRFYNLIIHDSIQVVVNDTVRQVYGLTPSFTFTDTKFIPDESAIWAKARVIGYTDGIAYKSESDSVVLLLSPSTNFTIDFSDPSDVVEAGFTVSQPAGFNSPGLHTAHPYLEGAELIATLRTPVKVQGASGIYYKDVAIVEPGEPGAQYPSVYMWDYVTVEGSLDGNHWTILISPYDCRLNTTWQSIYDAEGNGTEAMMIDQKINLNDYYNDGDVVIIRFRLFSDEAAYGWGWAVDDIVVTDNFVSDIEDQENLKPIGFNLVGNYPNPFNPGTTIKFSVEPGQTATMDIFNSLGQRVKTLFKNKLFNMGQEQQFYWDGKNHFGVSLSSGIYFYRLQSNGKTASRRMLLLK